MQKCEPADAVLIERDLAAFRAKHREVKDNLDALLQRLNADEDDDEEEVRTWTLEPVLGLCIPTCGSMLGYMACS